MKSTDTAGVASSQRNPETWLATEMLKRMRQLNLSRRELAIKAGLSRQTVHHIENGRSVLQPQTLGALDAALHWPSGSAAALAAGEIQTVNYDAVTEEQLANHYRWRIVQQLQTLSREELEAMLITSGWDLDTP